MKTATRLMIGASLALTVAAPSIAAVCGHAPPTGATCVPVAKATSTPLGVPTTSAAGWPALHLWPNNALVSSLGIPSPGYNKATAHTQFVKVMNYNWNPTYTWSRMINESLANLTDVELARLTKQYAAEGGNIQTWVDLFIGSISTGAQRRIAAVTSDQIVINGLAKYGSSAIAAFDATPAYIAKRSSTSLGGSTAVPRSFRMYEEMGLNVRSALPASILPPPPNVDFTLYEIYLEYRTGALAMSITAALYATGGWAKVCLSGAFAAGYSFGNDLLYIGNSINPNFQSWLNGEIGDSIDEYIMNAQLPSEPGFSEDCGCTVTIEWDQMTYKD